MSVLSSIREEHAIRKGSLPPPSTAYDLSSPISVESGNLDVNSMRQRFQHSATDSRPGYLRSNASMDTDEDRTPRGAPWRSRGMSLGDHLQFSSTVGNNPSSLGGRDFGERKDVSRPDISQKLLQGFEDNRMKKKLKIQYNQADMRQHIQDLKQNVSVLGNTFLSHKKEVENRINQMREENNKAKKALENRFVKLEKNVHDSKTLLNDNLLKFHKVMNNSDQQMGQRGGDGFRPQGFWDVLWILAKYLTIGAVRLASLILAPFNNAYAKISSPDGQQAPMISDPTLQR